MQASNCLGQSQISEAILYCMVTQKCLKQTRLVAHNYSIQLMAWKSTSVA